MSTLERRIEALERTEPTIIGPLWLRYVGIGEADKEIETVWGCGGRWERLPGESESELKERAKKEAKPNPKGVQVFQCT